MSDVELFGKALGLMSRGRASAWRSMLIAPNRNYIAMIYLVVGKLDPGPAI